MTGTASDGVCSAYQGPALGAATAEAPPTASKRKSSSSFANVAVYDTFPAGILTFAVWFLRHRLLMFVNAAPEGIGSEASQPRNL